MRDDKWLDDLEPSLAVTEAARRALFRRLAVVAEYLPRVKREAGRDPENVHQLRVATRRADAALRIFRLTLPGKAYRLARKRLRTIRKAAGAARDWDVFLADLRERLAQAAGEPRHVPNRKSRSARRPQPATDNLAGLDFLIGHALGQRSCAQHLLEAVEEDQDEVFEGFVSRLLDEVDLPSKEDRAGLVELARTLMPELLARLERAAADDLTSYERLHQVRIAGKRLRYAMEVFVACYAPSFREEVYPQVEQMQEILGRANDSHVAAGRLLALREELRDWHETWGRVGKGIEELQRFHQERLEQQRQQFLAWWQRWNERLPQQLLPLLADVGT